jgi:WD40-like Beta Propeller Repeat
MKVALDGGAPVEICATVNLAGGAWGGSGVIVFSPGTIYSGLLRVSADGGTAEPATLIDSAQRDTAHRWPVFLPDGIHFLYFVRSLIDERRGVYVGRIDRPASTPGAALFRSESEAIYAAGQRSGDVWMLPTTTGGTPRSLLAGSFVERDARFSPDGDLIAYVSYESGNPEISVRTVEGTPQREVVSVSGGTQPVWRRDGAELLFVDLDGLLSSVAVHRSGKGRPVVGNPTRVNILPIGAGHTATQYDLSPDGRRVYFLDRRPAEPPREIGIVLGWRGLLK